MNNRFNSLLQGIRPSVLIFVVSVALGCWVEASAQSIDPTTLMQGLSSSQKDALMRQAGKSGATAGTITTPNQIVVSKPPADSVDFFNGRIQGGETVLVDLLPLYEYGSTLLKSKSQKDPTLANLNTSDPNAATLSSNNTVAMPADITGAQRTAVSALTDIEKTKLNDVFERLMRANPYELNKDGVMELPGLGEIKLLGLSPSEAQTRLALDPRLQHFQVGIRVIKVEPTDAKALKPFGYDLFKNAASALVPGTDVPAPDDYKLSTGDQLTVQLFGQSSQVYNLPVSRDGVVSIPELGPVNVAGMNLGAARSLIEGRVAKQMIGTQVHVTLGEMRAARVLVVGDAQNPGTFVLSGLSSASGALFASGGVKIIGSLRNIEIKRSGQLLRKLDLYDVLLNGDTQNDLRLQSGDVVFVPPVGPTVGVAGEIKRPAIYETTKEKTVGAVMALAGGVTVDADLKLATLERTEAGQIKKIINLNLETSEGLNALVRNGDILRIPSIRPQLTNGITIDGQVYRPGTYAYRTGMRVSDLLGSVDDLKAHADIHYVLIRHEELTAGRISVRSVDLEAALKNRGSDADTPLQPRDRITVFDLNNPRDRINTLLMDLRRQGSPDNPTKTIMVMGSVNAPGEYPLEEDMRLADAIRAGGGLKDQAYATTAELTRYTLDGQMHRVAHVEKVNLEAALRGDAAANVRLSSYDNVSIQQTPRWLDVEEVELMGEVEFPGRYRIQAGETLSQLLKRAGGLTDRAFPKGAIFLRDDLKQREQEQLDRIASRLQATVLANSSMAANADKNSQAALAVGQALVEQVRSAKPVGRLVIDLPTLLRMGRLSNADVVLRKGDKIVIPPQVQEVSVLGEVENPTSHLYKAGMTESSVIALSGGFTDHADKSHAYVLRADGSVAVQKGHFIGGRNISLEPGDTVVVPVDSQQLPGIAKWQSITNIVYNLAVATSSLKTLGVL